MIVDSKNNIIGLVNEHNTIVPVKSEPKQSKHEREYQILAINKLEDIDFMINTELNVIDQRVSKVNEINNEQNLYNLIKFSLSKFIQKYNGHIVKTMKNEVLEVLQNTNFPYPMKFNQIKIILQPIFEKIVTLVETKFNSNYTDSCIDKNESKCNSLNNCKFIKNRIYLIFVPQKLVRFIMIKCINY